MFKNKEKLNTDFTFEVNIAHNELKNIIGSFLSKRKSESTDNNNKVYKCIKNYDWNSIKNVSELFFPDSTQLCIEKCLEKSQLYYKRIMDEESLNSMIAEWIFGSYSRWWTLDIINENNKLHYLSKIKERHAQIQFLITNMILSQRKSKEYIANILSIIHDIVSRNWLK